MGKSEKNQGDSKLWKILNSGFFLWFLSAIVLGSSSFLYTKWYENKQKILATEQKIEKLDLEISSRLSFCAEQILAKESLKNALLVLENPKKSKLPISVFPEFSERSLRALLWELKSLVDPEEKKLILAALKEANNFKKIYLATKKKPDFFDTLLQKDKKIKTETKAENKIDKVDKRKGSGALKRKDQTPQKNVSKNDQTPLVIAIKPIHITIDMNIMIQRNIELIKITMEVFNLSRWDKPFDDLVVKMETRMRTKTQVNGENMKGTQPTSTKLFNEK